jgi:hypothetical protein
MTKCVKPISDLATQRANLPLRPFRTVHLDDLAFKAAKPLSGLQHFVVVYGPGRRRRARHRFSWRRHRRRRRRRYHRRWRRCCRGRGRLRLWCPGELISPERNWPPGAPPPAPPSPVRSHSSVAQQLLHLDGNACKINHQDNASRIPAATAAAARTCGALMGTRPAAVKGTKPAPRRHRAPGGATDGRWATTMRQGRWGRATPSLIACRVTPISIGR